MTKEANITLEFDDEGKPLKSNALLMCLTQQDILLFVMVVEKHLNKIKKEIQDSMMGENQEFMAEYKKDETH